MSIHFHPLTICDIRNETNDCVSVAFEVPESLKDVFAFQHGQNITLRMSINGEDLRRSYSICSSPLDNELRVAVKSVADGRFSAFANSQLKKGDTLEVLPPTGKFYTELHPGNKKEYVAFAAGSGITPILSIIKTTLATEPESSFTLVYGNRNRASIIFRDSLEALKNKRIAGAAIDVTAEEPLPPTSPLWAADDLFITPHTAGETRRYEDNVIDILLENLDRLWRNDGALRNQIV